MATSFRLSAIFPYRLNVTEFTQAKMRQLAAKAALFHAAERHSGIARAIAINKYATALQLISKTLRLRRIGSKDGSREPKLTVVG